MIKTGTVGKWILPALLPVALTMTVTGCNREEAISFSQDVKPIIEKNCVACHQPGGKGYEASGFNMTSYTDLMEGTKFGPMIIRGDSAGSNMLVLMEGRADPSISMPHGTMKPIAQPDIDTIRLWIDQGAKNN